MRSWLAVLVLAVVACGGGNKQSTTCGDGIVDTGEACDGAANCTSACTWACSDPATDCTPQDCQIASCSAEHACALTPANDGTSCGSNGTCASGSCIPATCGNGVLEAGEQCDFGTDNGAVAGCELNCTFSCSTLQNNCDDGDPCNGTETCGSVTDNGATGQACLSGTPLTDGTTCGTNMVCKNAVCSANVCGDGYVGTTEECDDANAVSGDGCESNCTFSCVSTDATRNCTPADPCEGQGTCNDTTHVCAAGTPLTNGTSCGGNNYCKNGTCTMPMCGNGIVEPGEDCDGGSNCKADCTWVCKTPATDCGTAPACDMWTCSAQHTCQAVADSGQNGMACGTGGTCSNGTCSGTGAMCGNGVVEGTEQCDFGAGNGAGTGCETSCQYSCQSNTSCDDGLMCDGAETCSTVTVSGHTGKKCAAGTPLADGTSCGTGKICNAGTCATSSCGDGVRVTGEQCDDGNTTNLDGCDSGCKFEQSQRATEFKVAFTHSTSCPNDALGENIVGNNVFGQAGSRTQITQAIDNGIADGSITVNFVALGLDDLTGTADSSVSIGVVGGTPATSSAATYSGTNDVDWWYATDSTSINASRAPIHQLNGSISARTLTVGPGEIVITVSFVGVAVTMDIFDTTVTADIGASSAITMSTNGMTPGHLSSEHDASLTTFLTMGTQPTTPSGCASTTCRCRDYSGNVMMCPTGEMCGNTTAASLYNVLVPTSMTGATCGNLYTTSNTLLDIYISGCNYNGSSFFPQIKATQPDASRDGATYTFQVDANHHVNGCKRNNVAATLQTCLDNAGYSSLFQFTSDRVIAK